ncbi:aquaporin [Streptomyces sp. DG2A-72]|uniref:aquaporin n=1 Tax=Streptomyces sp. DG2A-72 TaxID=3051386 RepID=UPI00265BCF62|nr:aquaporin [Streptomyces sp. DG2A-72]MDO0930511.1 aquaporin [Streptomyces sp. DG2A-72]
MIDPTAPSSVFRHSAQEFLLTFVLLFGVLAARGMWGSGAVSRALLRWPTPPCSRPDWSATGALPGGDGVDGLPRAPRGAVLSVHWLTRFIPCLVGFLICLSIALLGTSTGGSLNPAHHFGPALGAGQSGFLWVCLLALMLGAVLAPVVRDLLLGHRRVLTHRLHGAHADRSPVHDHPTP